MGICIERIEIILTTLGGPWLGMTFKLGTQKFGKRKKLESSVVSVFENGRFGSLFHFRLAVLVGVLDFETPTR